MFFWILHSIAWLIWIILADKKRWRELFIVSILAGFLGAISDHLFVCNYPLWSYIGQPKMLKNTFDDIGIYIVVPYLFIQWLPKEKTLKKLVPYFFLWTLLAISIELIHIKLGRMQHHHCWTIWHSYIADWVLFCLFYNFHRIFKLARLSEDKE